MPLHLLIIHIPTTTSTAYVIAALVRPLILLPIPIDLLFLLYGCIVLLLLLLFGHWEVIVHILLMLLLRRRLHASSAELMATLNARFLLLAHELSHGGHMTRLSSVCSFNVTHIITLKDMMVKKNVPFCLEVSVKLG